MRRASSVSPPRNARTRFTISVGATLDEVEITPLLPIARSGSVLTSSPERIASPSGQAAIILETCSKSPLDSFTATTCSMSARRAIVSASMFEAVRPGML